MIERAPRKTGRVYFQCTSCQGSASHCLFISSTTFTEFMCVCLHIIYIYTHIYDKNSSPNTLNEIHNLKTFKINMYRPSEVVTTVSLSVQITYTVSKINIS